MHWTSRAPSGETCMELRPSRKTVLPANSYFRAGENDRLLEVGPESIPPDGSDDTAFDASTHVIPQDGELAVPEHEGTDAGPRDRILEPAESLRELRLVITYERRLATGRALLILGG